MKQQKNPGLGARLSTVSAAVAASAAIAGAPALAGKRRAQQPDDVALSVRLPKVMHDELRRLAYENRVPIHGMILEGVRMYLESKG